MGSSRREFLKQGAAAFAIGASGIILDCHHESLSTDGTLSDGGPNSPQNDSSTADRLTDGKVTDNTKIRPATTVRERIQGLLPPEKQPSELQKQWGVIQKVPGEAHQRTDLLNVDSLAITPTGPANSIFYFTQLSDIHIIDEESPARTINLDQIVSPAWRFQEAYSTQLLDAMIHKIHQLNELRAIDCVVFTGDLIDNNQRNELDWFLEVVSGAMVTPNSGSVEDPIKGDQNDPHDTFIAKGLGTIPWYPVIGNHDALIQGNLPHGIFGKYSLPTGDPTRDKIGSIALGRVNTPVCNPIPTSESSTPQRCIPNEPQKLKSGSLPADKQRQHLTKKEWIEQMLLSSGLPEGHGLDDTNLVQGHGDYVAEPVNGAPVRLVVLDTTSEIGAEGSYSRIESFLEPALSQAQKDEVLVIVVSHHPSSDIFGAFRNTLHSCPNVILHVVGHGHHNKVIARTSKTPQQGYWEVQTASLLDWPLQGRLFELVDKKDGLAELWLTVFDFDTTHQPGGPLVQGARFLSLYELHKGVKGGGKKAEGEPTDRNVILPVMIPLAVQKKLALLPAKPIESKLFA